MEVMATLAARMSKQQISLRDWARKKIKEKGLTYQLVARRARQMGYTISDSYAGTIVNNEETSPSIKYLQAFAAGIGESEDDAFSIARGKQMSDDPKYKESVFALMFKEYSQLPPPDRQEFDSTINLLRKNISDRFTERVREKHRKRE